MFSWAWVYLAIFFMPFKLLLWLKVFKTQASPCRPAPGYWAISLTLCDCSERSCFKRLKSVQNIILNHAATKQEFHSTNQMAGFFRIPAFTAKRLSPKLIILQYYPLKVIYTSCHCEKYLNRPELQLLKLVILHSRSNISQIF